MRRIVIGLAAFAALGAVAYAQGTAGRAPAWAQPLVATDIVRTTGGRAALAGEGIEFSARVTIAPNRGGVARVIRVDGRADGQTLSLRRFTGHPGTGWWLWGPDTPVTRPITAAERAELERLARQTLTMGGAGGDMGQCPASSSAYIEIAIGDRQTSASRTCLANDPGSQLVTAMSNLAGSRDEEELRAAAENELLEADRAFNAMAQADGVPAAFAHWAAEDAHQFSPGNDPARGRQAVTAFWANWPAGATLEWAPEHARVSSRGDMGWTWGRGVATVNGQQTRSRYVTIWVRDYDGNWRWAADIGNQDPAGAQ